jgi:hypothetical protein
MVNSPFVSFVQHFVSFVVKKEALRKEIAFFNLIPLHLPFAFA